MSSYIMFDALTVKCWEKKLVNHHIKVFYSSGTGTQQRQTETLCGVPDQSLKPQAPETCSSDNPTLTIGTLSAAGLKPVIRPIDKEA